MKTPDEVAALLVPARFRDGRVVTWRFARRPQSDFASPGRWRVWHSFWGRRSLCVTRFRKARRYGIIVDGQRFNVFELFALAERRFQHG